MELHSSLFCLPLAGDPLRWRCAACSIGRCLVACALEDSQLAHMEARGLFVTVYLLTMLSVARRKHPLLGV